VNPAAGQLLDDIASSLAHDLLHSHELVELLAALLASTTETTAALLELTSPP
jgi:hypothetical protein